MMYSCIFNIIINFIDDNIIKALENDKHITENTINEILNSNLKINLSYNLKETVDTSKKIKNKADEDHPLVMDVLNKFKGEIIK